VLGTLVVLTALSAVLAAMGLLVALLGATRDERLESDLEAQGVGPRGLQAELRVRLALASWLATQALIGSRRASRRAHPAIPESGGAPGEVLCDE
jgi:hypothetical protein